MFVKKNLFDYRVQTYYIINVTVRMKAVLCVTLIALCLLACLANPIDEIVEKKVLILLSDLFEISNKD